VFRSYEVILLLEKSRAYGRALFQGVMQYARIHGSWRFHTEPEFYHTHKPQTVEWIRKLSANGVIAHVADLGLIKHIAHLGVPMVISSMKRAKVAPHVVVTDNDAIGRMAADYFLGRGFRCFAYCGFEEMYWSKQRGKSFCRKVTEAGGKMHVYRPPMRRKKPWTEENEWSPLVHWLRSLPRPTALLACNDDRGRQVLAACETPELKVPNDIAILGVDNDEFICETTYPKLSSITLNAEAAGYNAASLLGQLMMDQANCQPQNQIVVSPLSIVERASSSILAMEDREVAAALRFIREHPRELIQVDDVADRVGLSRRALQQRFHHILGHSVHDEVKRTRVDQMAYMLISTNLSIREIARFFQYDEVRNISRYFRQQTGLTPSQYRKKYGIRCPNVPGSEHTPRTGV